MDKFRKANDISRVSESERRLSSSVQSKPKALLDESDESLMDDILSSV
jgi:hypothetical protein